MHQLKYRRNMALGETLADQMSGYVKQLDWHFDIIVPIPLGTKRLKERGYNQSAMVAHPLALKLNVLYRPDLLIRSKETRSQVGLTRKERKNNISNAFIATSKAFGKTILIIDDVATTGSTLSAAAEALLLAGAEKVYAFTVARALKHQMAHA
jgi:ComF family protein